MIDEKTPVYPAEFYKVHEKYRGDFPKSQLECLIYYKKAFSIKLLNEESFLDSENGTIHVEGKFF